MRNAWVVIGGLVLLGCPPKETTTTDTKPSSSTKASGESNGEGNGEASGGPASTGSAAPDPSAGGLAIKPLAKAELDGKEPDADHKGSSLSVKDAKHAFTVPTGWTKTQGETTKAVADGDKSRFGATHFADGDDTGKKTEAVSKDLELTGCKWGSDESIGLGKDKIASKVADGVCKRGKEDVRAIRAIVEDEKSKIVAVGAWDDKGGDQKGVLNSFRSLAELKTVKACCSALAGNMANAPPGQKPIYAARGAFCQTLVNNPQWRQAIGGKLPGVTIPAACR